MLRPWSGDGMGEPWPSKGAGGGLRLCEAFREPPTLSALGLAPLLPCPWLSLSTLRPCEGSASSGTKPLESSWVSMVLVTASGMVSEASVEVEDFSLLLVALGDAWLLLLLLLGTGGLVTMGISWSVTNKNNWFGDLKARVKTCWHKLCLLQGRLHSQCLSDLQHFVRCFSDKLLQLNVKFYLDFLFKIFFKCHSSSATEPSKCRCLHTKHTFSACLTHKLTYRPPPPPNHIHTQPLWL